MDTLTTDALEEALVELASMAGDTLPRDMPMDLPTTHSGSAPSKEAPSAQFPAEWDAAKIRPMPRHCEFMNSMDPAGAPRHQCPNAPVILMELDIGVSPTYRWACEVHANERIVPLKVMIVRRFKGKA
jgi:hypothetical protein